MIARITGTLEAVDADASTVLVVNQGLGYTVHVPRSTLESMNGSVGRELTLQTMLHLEGTLAGSSFVPRLYGFRTTAERELFQKLTQVKGVSMRKALRAMTAAPSTIAAAIERSDERFLTGLPEIGKKTAGQIVADLRGKLSMFVQSDSATAPAPTLNGAEQIALDILIQWGDRAADAQRWIRQAVAQDTALEQPEDIVKAAYRVKAQAGSDRA